MPVKALFIAIVALALAQRPPLRHPRSGCTGRRTSTVRRSSVAAWRGSPCSPETVADEQADPFGVALDSSHVYWTTTEDDGVWRCAIGAPLPCTGEAVASGEMSQPTGIALSSSHIYWANNTPGEIRRCPLSASLPCTAETLASAPDASYPAVNDTHVYWTEFDGGLIRPVRLAAGSRAPLRPSRRLRIIRLGSH